MSDITSRVMAVRQYVDDGVASAMAHLIEDAPDFALNRVNPLTFARTNGLSEQESIAAFLHATQLGLFELSWNVVCESCGGVLYQAESLQGIDQHHYKCAICSLDCEPTLDETVEITFTVSPRIRHIAAHDPDTMPLWDYTRQIFWSSGSDLPEDLAPAVSDALIDAFEVAPGASMARQVQLNEGTAILFDPVTHSSRFLEVTGDPSDSQRLRIEIDDTHATSETLRVAPGLLTLNIENRTNRRIMPILWIVGEALAAIVARRVPVLTAKRLLTHQTFRDIYRTNVLDINQRFKITNLTFLFTDLKGSTELYDRIGDLAAFDLVRLHFQLMHQVVSAHGGAVVKTIGDAIMATFPTPAQGVAAAFDIRKVIDELNRRDSRDDLFLKVGLHSGPCLAVLMNERQDYFGQTVNIASRLQNIAISDLILATSAVIEDEEAHALIAERGSTLQATTALLRGLSGEIPVYGIPA
jgi:class 3 adenylate cyclase